MKIAKFELSHKANLKINSDKIVVRRKHVPRRCTGGSAPRQKVGEKPKVPKYEPLPYENEKLNKAFENLVPKMKKLERTIILKLKPKFPI